MRIFILILIIGFIQKISYSQTVEYQGSTFTVGLSHLELKDKLNHGLVFRGPDIRLNYGYENIDSNKYFSYSFALGGGGKTTKGTWGFIWYLSPIDIHYSWSIKSSGKSKFYLGPSFRVQYNIQNYPELHAGSISWLTSYDLGFHFSGFFSLKEKMIELKVRNSLLSLSSRPPLERDPYFFSTKIGDNISNIHSNMSVGTINSYNETELSATIYFNRKKRLKSLSYKFNYVGYFAEPSYIQIIHKLQYTWYLTKKKP